MPIVDEFMTDFLGEKLAKLHKEITGKVVVLPILLSVNSL